MVHILAIGNAVVDIVVKVDDAFLSDHNLVKGGMVLIDADQAKILQSTLNPQTVTSGGSVANSVHAAAALGAKAAFIGLVKDDHLGRAFRNDLDQSGITYPTRPATNGPSTAHCLVCVTPDGERSMATYLGASTAITTQALDEKLIARSQCLLLEGYLFHAEHSRNLMEHSALAAQKADIPVALSLSDAGLVRQWRTELLRFIGNHVTILIANEAECQALANENDFNSAAAFARTLVPECGLTRSENGSVVSDSDNIHSIAAETVDTVIDSTGAGDAWAAGFLYGRCLGYSLAKRATLANRLGAEILGRFGARGFNNLKTLMTDLETI